MIRKAILVIATFVLLCSIVACQGAAPLLGPPAEINIGCVVSMTGPLATMGLKMRDGAVLAVKELNTTGGIAGRKVKLLVEDDATDPATSLLAIKKLVELNEVEVIVGPMINDAVMVAGPYVSEREVLLISPWAKSPLISTQPWSRWVFRTAPSDALQGKALAKAIVDRGFKKVAILVQDKAYYVGIEYVAEQLLGDKADIVASIRYAPTTLDYRTELGTIKDKKPDCILHIGGSYDSAVMYTQALGMGLDTIQWVAGQDIHSESMFETPEAAEFMKRAVIGVQFIPPEGSLAYNEFTANYKKAFNTDPGPYCDSIYDAVSLVALAIEEAGVYEGAEVRDALCRVGRDYPGASGPITFDETGDRYWAPYEEWELEYEDGIHKFARVRLPPVCWPWCHL